MTYAFTFLEYLSKGLIGVAPILLPLIVFIVTNGILIGRIEGWRRGDAIYHAFINATTVGYGDLRPTRGSTKALAVVNAFLGLLLTGIFVGTGVYAVDAALRGTMQ